MLNKIQFCLQAIADENYREMSNIVRQEIGNAKIAELIKTNGSNYKVEIMKTVASILFGELKQLIKFKNGDALLTASGEEYIYDNKQWQEISWLDNKTTEVPQGVWDKLEKEIVEEDKLIDWLKHKEVISEASKEKTIKVEDIPIVTSDGKNSTFFTELRKEIGASEDKCPECEAYLIYESGCRHCSDPACGYAVCG